MEQIILEYLKSIKHDLLNNRKTGKSFKVKSLLNQLGYQRRSQLFIEYFNKALAELELITKPGFDMNLRYEDRVTISLSKLHPLTNEIEIMNTSTAKNNLNNFEILKVKQDLFYYLFDFNSEQEYESFQACLSSNKPVGLFLIPSIKDFFLMLSSKY